MEFTIFISLKHTIIDDLHATEDDSSLQSIIILSMIYARSTTFSIQFILGKMKFPVFSLIFFTEFQIPCVFPDIKSNFQIP